MHAPADSCVHSGALQILPAALRCCFDTSGAGPSLTGVRAILGHGWLQTTQITDRRFM